MKLENLRKATTFGLCTAAAYVKQQLRAFNDCSYLNDYIFPDDFTLQ